MKKLFICFIGIFTFYNVGHTHNLAKVMNDVLPAVTYIRVEHYNLREQANSLTKVKVPTRPIVGTGFMIDSHIVVTNYHVVSFSIKHNTKIQISFSSNNTRYTAQIIGYDKIADVALLTIAGEHPFVDIVNCHTLRMGDEIFSISNFYGIGWSGTQGIVSSVDRDDTRYPYLKNLQLQILQGTGSSGGPVFDKHGHVVGLNHSIISMFPTKYRAATTPDMLSMVAYPIRADTLNESIKLILDEIIVRRVDLGVMMADFAASSNLHINYSKIDFVTGVFVLNVDKTSLTLLKSADIILDVNGEKFTDPALLLKWLDDKYEGGDKISLHVYRDGKAINIPVILETIGL